jgi:DNA-directed RNA polymerase specialized sigma24 family protein
VLKLPADRPYLKFSKENREALADIFVRFQRCPCREMEEVYLKAIDSALSGYCDNLGTQWKECEADDLCQEARLASLKALRTYDPERKQKCSLTAWMSNCIYQELRNYRNTVPLLVRMPRKIRLQRIPFVRLDDALEDQRDAEAWLEWGEHSLAEWMQEVGTERERQKILRKKEAARKYFSPKGVNSVVDAPGTV